mgnify:CR=1 FL=1
MMTKTPALLSLLALTAACSNASDSAPDGSPLFVDAELPIADAAPSPDAEGGVDVDAASTTPVSLRINELLKNPPGGLDTHEFFEVFGSANADLSDFSILVIEGDSTAGDTIGVLDMIVPLGTTDGDGFHVTEFFGDQVENGSITVVLVRKFDTEVAVGTDLDTDDDGQLDLLPWVELIDSVSLVDDVDDTGYSPTLLTDDLGGENEEFVGASRFPDGANTGAITDWVRANGEGTGLEDIQGAGGLLCDSCGQAPARAGRAVITPGASNTIVPAT